MERLDPTQRELLAADRAQVWRGKLTVEEFAGRNATLYAHPFGQSRMKTFALRKDGAFAASLDTVQVPLLVSDAQGAAQVVNAQHLASVLTLPTFRKQGLANELINSYLAQVSPAWSTLFSGIGPHFYEPFGYVSFPLWQCSRPAGPVAPMPCRSMSVESFADRVRETRRLRVERSPVPCAVFYPDALWWDWLGCIYQYFSYCRDLSTAPRGRFWEIETETGSVWAAGMEDPVGKTWDLWWVSQESEAVLAFFAGLAGEAKVEKLRWWSSRPSPAAPAAHPMLRAPGPMALGEVQLGDWW